GSLRTSPDLIHNGRSPLTRGRAPRPARMDLNHASHFRASRMEARVTKWRELPQISGILGKPLWCTVSAMVWPAPAPFTSRVRFLAAGEALAFVVEFHGAFADREVGGSLDLFHERCRLGICL